MSKRYVRKILEPIGILGDQNTPMWATIDKAELDEVQYQESLKNDLPQKELVQKTPKSFDGNIAGYSIRNDVHGPIVRIIQYLDRQKCIKERV